MPEVRKTSTNDGPRGVVYDLHAARPRTTPPEAVREADRSGITEGGRELSRAHAAVEAAADVRTERVRALREKIARGEYKPDPREVARKLIERGF
jgi:flagellar biosynthesis anti-sigma factor FlgM